MENSGLVSCIITTYNRPDLVGNAIESVLEQSYQNFEIIVIDDHSSESYYKIIDKYKKYSNIKFFRNKENLRLSASRNRGISLSNGSYVAFLDDDDRWLPTKLEKQREILINNPSYIACSSCHIESESKRIIDRGIREFSLNDLLGFNLIGPPSKIMVRKSILDDVNFSERAQHAEDWDFYLKLLRHGKIYMIKEPLIIYNTGHFTRMTNGFSSLTIKEIQEKANITYENRVLIGEANFRLRLAHYYFTGFLERKNKLSFLYTVINEVGFFVAISVFVKMTRRKMQK